MSGFAGVAALIGADVLQEVFIQPRRMIGTLIPECAIEEHHSDRLQVTHHPIEIGAEVSDHAYMLPLEVTLRYGWSNAIIGGQIQNLGSRLAGITSLEGLLKGSGFLGPYTELQQLQKSREPFEIVTGKRNYTDMLITEMSVTTDEHTENALIVELHCQQIIRVKTETVAVAPASAQTMPQQTSDVVDTGQQQLVSTGSVPAGVA